jgi:hypothetical protein
MDIRVHNRISKRLEKLKASGFLSEYLIAWSGPSGALVPGVTVWRRNCQEAQLRRSLSESIGNLVPLSKIVILNDET